MTNGRNSTAERSAINSTSRTRSETKTVSKFPIHSVSSNPSYDILDQHYSIRKVQKRISALGGILLLPCASSSARVREKTMP